MGNYICEKCGISFYQRPSHRARKVHAICSRKCAVKFYVGEMNHMYKRVENTCGVCNKKFFTTVSTVRKTCSRACAGIIIRKRISLKCDTCGTNITKVPALLHNHNFCSRTCADKFHSKAMSGSGNSRWIGGVQKDGYTFDFDDIKRRIRVRDNNRCRYCLYNNREDITDSLAVHHIDYNKQNNSNNNLITLCNSCHMHIHRTKYEWKSLLSAIISNDEKEKSK